MAFNEILVGRLNRYVQKLLVIKNTALRSLNPDLQANLSLFSGAEERYLQGWQRFSLTTTISAVAAQLSLYQMRNPAGSGIVAILEAISVFAGANELITLAVLPQTADAGTILTPALLRMDPRGQPTSSMKLSSGTGTLPAFGTAAAYRSFAGLNGVAGQPIQTVNQEWTILPGDAFQVLGELVNTQMSVAVIWRERVLESSELT